MAITLEQPKFGGAPPGMHAAEWQARCELAACYQLTDLYGMSDMAGTHISLSVPGRNDEYLLNPFGVFFDEITASSLLRVDHTGKVLSGYSGPLNMAGFKIHGAVHRARPDLACILHTHTEAINAIGMQQEGLLPLNQTALTILGFLAYHDFEGPAVGMQSDEQVRLLENLGEHGRCVIMRNHGGLTVGATAGEAFVWMEKLEKACRFQLAAEAGGKKLVRPSEAIIARSIEVGRRVYSKGGLAEAGALEWPALIRKLERERGASYRT
jgi:ribulose-5-phosphate 4-epimerase/fuculose-1-phosphate aldolase